MDSLRLRSSAALNSLIAGSIIVEYSLISMSFCAKVLHLPTTSSISLVSLNEHKVSIFAFLEKLVPSLVVVLVVLVVVLVVLVVSLVVVPVVLVVSLVVLVVSLVVALVVLVVVLVVALVVLVVVLVVLVVLLVPASSSSGTSGSSTSSIVSGRPLRPAACRFGSLYLKTTRIFISNI